MVELVCIRKAEENQIDYIEENITESTEPGPVSGAIVPTIDIYTARVLFNLTQKIVEDTIDKRVSFLEEKIEERDMEIMRSIRRIQSRMAIRHGREKLSWWQKVFSRKSRDVL